MTKFEIAIGNIAELKADAIVNAANEQLAAGSGVCGAIFEKAGPGLAEEIRNELGHGCETGDAVTTAAYGLDAKHIIHAVAPIWSGMPYDRLNLERAYLAIFREAQDWDIRSIAIPSLGTGVYGWNLEDATSIAKQGILRGLRDYPMLEKITFSCFTDEAAKIYEYLFQSELAYGLDFRLRCPKCGNPALPITYGMPSQEEFDDPNFYSGGCIIGPGQANWACKDCEIEFA